MVHNIKHKTKYYTKKIGRVRRAVQPSAKTPKGVTQRKGKNCIIYSKKLFLVVFPPGLPLSASGVEWGEEVIVIYDSMLETLPIGITCLNFKSTAPRTFAFALRIEQIKR